MFQFSYLNHSTKSACGLLWPVECRGKEPRFKSQREGFTYIYTYIRLEYNFYFV